MSDPARRSADDQEALPRYTPGQSLGIYLGRRAASVPRRTSTRRPV
ncbi:hypothetical protein SAMN05216272_109134 [Pseudomonas panipatensis]|uniref:Uncharacterized protein n=1 Tax=Pseudomonas panipatensis TaxID=428992 RepID=A0A1G8KME7_9PSED|nr:hypothetical protein SAMN05216272_109134 [Pseudomonas panipatensis]SMP70097.1 hypothetical protein SAMN06295951_109134 [Pseudomonas panipatensis]